MYPDKLIVRTAVDSLLPSTNRRLALWPEKRYFPRGLIAVLVLIGLGGCVGYDKVAPVSGTVTLDGDPVERASLLFEPEKGGRPSYGITDKQGNYKLFYSRTQNGAEVGPSVVRISKLKDEDDDASAPQVRIPKRYDKEPVKVTVLPRRNTIDIELTTDP